MKMIGEGQVLDGYQMAKFGVSGAHAQWKVAGSRVHLCVWDTQVWDASALAEFAELLQQVATRLKLGVEE